MTDRWGNDERKEYHREYNRKRKAACKARGICVSCLKNPAVENRSSCRQCLDDKKLCAKFGKAGPYRLIYSDLFEKQNGCCAICNARMLRPVLDHCHSTMEVIGLLCSNCNNGLGQFKDDIELLELAIHYLKDKDRTRTRVYLVRN